MNDIKRYDISYSERYGFDKEEDPNGEYVEWEDHAAAIAAKDARIAELEKLRARPARQVGGDGLAQFEAEDHDTVEKICELFKIGSNARTQACILTNIQNTKRFADMLHAVETEFFMVMGEPDEDDPDGELQPESLLNCWGSTVEQYVQKFGEVLHACAALAPAAVVEVDIVETLIQAIDAEQERLSSEDDYLMDSDDCIEVIRGTVANLNRRAIPAGLLEKLAHCTNPDCCIAHARAELRALLGKS